MFAFCALGVGALKGWGSWAACGEGRDPSPHKTAAERGSGLLLWGLHHLLCFPGGDSDPSQASLTATSSKSLAIRCLLAGFSSVPYACVERLLCARRGAGCLGRFWSPRLPSWHLWHFGGVVQGRACGHVVLNTCSFCLRVFL